MSLNTERTKYFQTVNLHPENIFQKERQDKYFNICKMRENITSRPALQEMLKTVFQT